MAGEFQHITLRQPGPLFLPRVNEVPDLVFQLNLDKGRRPTCFLNYSGDMRFIGFRLVFFSLWQGKGLMSVFWLFYR